MKKGIHPKYYQKAKIKCACGAEYEVGSTKEYMEVEICAKCHPFYTGKEKIVDTLGQVQKFRKKWSKTQQK
jgi:large subunit ribosomal protein L31